MIGNGKALAGEGGGDLGEEAAEVAVVPEADCAERSNEDDVEESTEDEDDDQIDPDSEQVG